MRDDAPRSPVLELGLQNSPPIVNRRIGCRKWLIAVLGLLVLIFVGASIRYLHPSAFLSMPDGITWHERSFKGHLRQPHKREQPGRRQVSTSPADASPSIVFPTTSFTSNSPGTTLPSTTAAVNMPVPTIPSSTSTLPTPFPQPIANLAKNFSSVSCYNFFANMTAVPSFRSCRPLSLLMDSSNDFSNAQKNLTLMNSIIWGTCNTRISKDQCVSNMGEFADELQKACVQDLQKQNEMAVSTLRDLRAYPLMRDAGCLTDPASNTYCYLDAVQNDNLYFYSLPLGIPVLNTTKPLCTACMHDLMSRYFTALSNSTEASVLTGLQQTYGNAAKLAVAQCGTEFAETTVASAVPAVLLPGQWTAAALLLGVMLQILS